MSPNLPKCGGVKPRKNGTCRRFFYFVIITNIHNKLSKRNRENQIFCNLLIVNEIGIQVFWGRLWGGGL